MYLDYYIFRQQKLFKIDSISGSMRTPFKWAAPTTSISLIESHKVHFMLHDVPAGDIYFHCARQFNCYFPFAHSLLILDFCNLVCATNSPSSKCRSQYHSQARSVRVEPLGDFVTVSKCATIAAIIIDNISSSIISRKVAI